MKDRGSTVYHRNETEITLGHIAKWDIGYIHFSTGSNSHVSPIAFLETLLYKCSPAVPFFYMANSDHCYNIFKGKKIVDVPKKTETAEEENTFEFPNHLIQSRNWNLTDIEHELDQWYSWNT